jgi:hypothetical protein
VDVLIDGLIDDLLYGCEDDDVGGLVDGLVGGCDDLVIFFMGGFDFSGIISFSILTNLPLLSLGLTDLFMQITHD